ncbi:tetratricopeptide repeat protein [Runella sp.]|jgi:tetratricopeptide (TPR) repeat protein|uniref:tetratricopeptide repeat protein n=1 Tax=Runella sp. TaxID=1960881 RepID=UPI0026195A14|nr:tetratricopeptide repeat protein [Runella sp.]
MSTNQYLFFLLFSVASFAQKPDNAELKKMYDEDQKARMASTIDWVQLSKNDSIRQKRVYELIHSGQLITGKDYYHSAMIFQHGTDTTASAMAVKLMKRAIDLDSTVNKWLLAAAIDRDLMRRDKPQIYGTQYIKMGQDAKWERYKIDSTQVTDIEREYYDVETLAEEKERTMNLRSISEFYSESQSLEKTLALIKAEKVKGDTAIYNVSEGEINSFGYELLSAKKANDALIIFTLNTELYPNGFNTFDSLGECLLILNKKEEGIKTYKKSLELNPKNKKAMKIVNDSK